MEAAALNSIRGPIRWTSDLVRRAFIDYFVRCGCTHVPSSSVLSADPSLLFVNAGMNQFKPSFLSTSPPSDRLVTNSQKCIRAKGKHNDLDAVGRDNYHHTFFEMLGNWSFHDAVPASTVYAQAYELLADVYGLDASRLTVTYFGGDAAHMLEADGEAKGFWSSAGLRVKPLAGVEGDNFWQMGATGPCGPCTEIHYDFGHGVHRELWNIVSIKHNRLADGSLELLPQTHIDTGMGFERLVALLQNTQSNYCTDLFAGIMTALHAHMPYLPQYRDRYSLNDIDRVDYTYRLISDHMRAIVVALADGAQPDKTDAGHVLRILVKRACYALSKLGCSGSRVLPDLVEPVAASLADAYPAIGEKVSSIRETVFEEAERAKRSIHRGRRVFRKVAAAQNGVLTEKNIRFLHGTHGLPRSLILEMAADHGVKIGGRR